MMDTDFQGPWRDAHTPQSARRAATVRRQKVRRRRSSIMAVVAMLGGTALARALEDPADIHALAAAQLAAVGRPASDAEDRAGRVSADGEAPVPAVPTTSPTTAGAPSGARPSTSMTPSPPVVNDGSGAPAPDATHVPVPVSGTGKPAAVVIPAGLSAITGRQMRYSVEVEGGLPVSSAEFARTVMTVLTDPRGWQTKDGVRFVPVSPQQLSSGAGVDVRVTLASPSLTAKLCAPLNVTIQQVSCWNGSLSVLNLTRWMRGSETYGSDLAGYRVYLISHEVGHGLGHGHVSCPAAGRPAPVMVQQTKSLEGCTASPWPTGT